VTHGREPLFGKVVYGEMVLNAYGKIVESTWHDLVNHNPDIGLDEFVVMPNHIHGIIVIFTPVEAGSQPARETGAGFSLREEREGAQRSREPAQLIRAGFSLREEREGAQRSREPAPTITKRKISLPEIVRQLKTFSAKRINALRGTPGVPVWQRNYYDRVIRSDREHEEIAAYIANNPANWLTDAERPPLENQSPQLH